MTKKSVIGQSEIERALKTCKRARYEKARIHINITSGTIDILIGEGAAQAPAAYNPWDEDLKDDPPRRPRTYHRLPTRPTPEEVKTSSRRARSMTRRGKSK